MSDGGHGIPPAPEVEGAEHVHSGKVRDLYRLGDGRLLMVASDRMSAFDFVLEPTIPDKGVVLTRMSRVTAPGFPAKSANTAEIR